MKQEKLFGGIDTVIIRVSNIVDARDWYTQTLGLNPIWDDPSAKLVVFDTGGPTSLTLWQTEKKIETDHHTAAYPIFSTHDASKARQLLLDRGVNAGEVITDEVTTYFFFFDPDSNTLEACQVHA